MTEHGDVCPVTGPVSRQPKSVNNNHMTTILDIKIILKEGAEIPSSPPAARSDQLSVFSSNRLWDMDNL